MPTRVAKYLFAPLLIVEGLRLRQRALNLPEPDGPRTGHTGKGQPLRLLIMGDSSAAGVGVTTQTQALSGQLATALSPHFDLSWRLEANTGDTTAKTLRRLQALPAQPFDAVVQALGVNDVTSGIPSTLWLRQQRQLHDLCRQKFGMKHLYVSGLPPMRHFPLLPSYMQWILGGEAERFDMALQRISSATPGIQHIAFDQPLEPTMMASDGFHPGPEVYHLWAEAIAARITNDFAKQSPGKRKSPPN